MKLKDRNVLLDNRNFDQNSNIKPIIIFKSNHSLKLININMNMNERPNLENSRFFLTEPSPKNDCTWKIVSLLTLLHDFPRMWFWFYINGICINHIPYLIHVIEIGSNFCYDKCCKMVQNLCKLLIKISSNDWPENWYKNCRLLSINHTISRHNQRLPYFEGKK